MNSTPPYKNMLGHTLDRLGLAILSGHYGAEGSVPPEAALCEELGVSRTVVREAVKSLAAKGMLMTGPKVGTRVLPADRWNWFDPQLVAWQSQVGLTREFLRDLQELRRVVEPAAVALAVSRADATDLEDLEQAYAGMRDAIELGGDYVQHDLAFHQRLLKASHNRMLVQMGKVIGALLRTSFEISTIKPNGAAQSLPLHRDVLDAIRARSAKRAEKAILTLIDGAAGDIESVLQSTRRLPSLTRPPTQLRPTKRAALAADKPPSGPID